MRRLIYILFFSLTFIVLDAQEEHLKPTIFDNTDPTRWLYVPPAPEPGIRGDQYLFETWKKVELVFAGGQSRNDLYVNLDLETQKLEISTEEGIKVIPNGMVKSFWYLESRDTVHFVGANRMDLSCAAAEVGYVEVKYASEETQLLVLHTLDVKKPSYNQRLGIGDNNIKRYKEQSYLVLREEKCATLSGSNKRIQKQLVDVLRNKRVNSLVDKNDLKLKDEKDLTRLFELIQA